MPARESWGLDIGQTAIHAVKLRRTKSGVEMVDAFFHPLETEIDDPEYDSKVLAGLEAFTSEKNVGGTAIVASLPGFATLFREFSLHR